jgi:hypothetical protein
MSACPACVQQVGDLGAPSVARWLGPDGEEYCSMHFVQKFGHAEKLVKVGNFQPPVKTKPPAPRRAKAPTR